MSFQCFPCKRTFSTEKVFSNHCRYSPAHKLKCEPSNRPSNIQTPLGQNRRGSPVHASPIASPDGGYSFRTEQALEEHRQILPVDAQTFNCVPCNRSFSKKHALEQHLSGSSVHTRLVECEICNRLFPGEEARNRHLRDIIPHRTLPNTPLDVFFHSFHTFQYYPSLSPATSFAQLQAHESWRRGDIASKLAWERYQDALKSELRMLYGAEDDMTAWHALYQVIGKTRLPKTSEHCEQIARGIHVNIIDLVEWGRRGDWDKTVCTFDDVAGLRLYTKRTKKIFHRSAGRREERNVVLKHLLRVIFHEE